MGAVKCENPSIGPHLSPKMFSANSGEDLYQLWLSVGPSFDDHVHDSDSDDNDSEDNDEATILE